MYRRTPRNFEGTQQTGHHIQSILPSILNNLSSKTSQPTDLILSAWPQVIGPKLAHMTKAISFISGTLTIQVSNPTLFSVLAHQERSRLLKYFQQHFPLANVKQISFKM